MHNAYKVDRYLRIHEAAEILSVSKSWIYAHKDKLPFVVTLPTGRLRISLNRLREFLERANDGSPE